MLKQKSRNFTFLLYLVAILKVNMVSYLFQQASLFFKFKPSPSPMNFENDSYNIMLSPKSSMETKSFLKLYKMALAHLYNISKMAWESGLLLGKIFVSG